MHSVHAKRRGTRTQWRRPSPDTLAMKRRSGANGKRGSGWARADGQPAIPTAKPGLNQENQNLQRRDDMRRPAPTREG